MRDQFRKWREESGRHSEDVVQLWVAVLEDKVHKTGNERHLILEQVIVAALDTARFDIATKCTKQLSAEFPGSLRVMKFKAMRLEALEQYDAANEVLDAIIEKDETNAAPRKRKIAIMKARGLRLDAIKELNAYLKKYKITYMFVMNETHMNIMITIDSCRIRKRGRNSATCIWPRVSLARQPFVWRRFCSIIPTVI